MRVGFGYLGEYQESVTYFKKALKQNPSSIVINNYKDFINDVISKYPYTPLKNQKIIQWLKLHQFQRGKTNCKIGVRRRH